MKFNIDKQYIKMNMIGIIIPNNKDLEESGLGKINKPAINPTITDTKMFFSEKEFE